MRTHLIIEVLLLSVALLTVQSNDTMGFDQLFEEASTLDVGNYPLSVTADDLDGDGDGDLAVANNNSNDLSVLLGNGDGTFASAVDYGVGDTPQAVAAADLDGDGDYDLVVANYDSDNVSILLNNSDRPPLPIISSITDIPNDQGRQVTLTWKRCGPDRPGSSVSITGYAVYRKIDKNLSSCNEPGERVSGSELKIDTGGRGCYSYPPGDWHYLTNVPARAESEYSIVVSTLADSTISDGMYYSTFFVSALTATPGVYYDSEPDSGYSVDNLRPEAPGAFAVDYNTGSGNHLSWEECEDEDFMRYNIYRSEESGFEPGAENLVHSTIDMQWIDNTEDSWKYNYKISSLDFSGNESDPREPDEVTGIEVPGVPSDFALYQNYPNPFNPVTTIRFDLPESSNVRIIIYSAKGRKVKILLAGKMTAGQKHVDWNGMNENGVKAASGVYFYRISADRFRETRKMILMR